MIYVVGAGYMAREYAKVLKALFADFIIIGRSNETTEKLENELNVKTVSGGLTNFLDGNNQIPDFVIVCTPVETLSSITVELLNYGIKNILIEKPGALSLEELHEIKHLSNNLSAKVHIGYNRRYYQSTLKLKEKLKSEELIAVNFEITEWAHKIVNETCQDIVKQKWVLANTSHVIDLVLDIVGPIAKISTYNTGKLTWHNSASRFVGSGISDSNVLLSYIGCWDGPGRWSVEFITKENRYIFCPMEKLQIQKIGTVSVELDENIDYTLDSEFKPGLFLQTKSFLEKDFSNLCTVDEQIESFEIYNKIANYK